MSIFDYFDRILQESGVLDNQEIGGEIPPVRQPNDTPDFKGNYLNDQEIGERYEGGYDDMYGYELQEKYDYTAKDRRDMRDAALGNDWAKGSHWHEADKYYQTAKDREDERRAALGNHWDLGEAKEWCATAKDRRDESRGMKAYEKKIHESLNMAMEAGRLMQEAQNEKDREDEKKAALGNDWAKGSHWHEADKYYQTAKDREDEKKAALGNHWDRGHHVKESYDPFDDDFFM